MIEPIDRPGPGWSDMSRFPFWLAVLGAVWSGIGGLAYAVPPLGGALVGAAVGATVSIFVYLANHEQTRRKTTLDLLTEYYSSDFAGDRRAAERFMTKHSETDWSKCDPYVLDKDNADLAGYGAVLRFWQRVAILDLEGELRSDLAHRLLAREVGYWNAVIFQPMKVRRNMYVQGLLEALVRRFSAGSQRDAFRFGERAGRAGRPSESLPKAGKA